MYNGESAGAILADIFSGTGIPYEVDEEIAETKLYGHLKTKTGERRCGRYCLPVALRRKLHDWKKCAFISLGMLYSPILGKTASFQRQLHRMNIFLM